MFWRFNLLTSHIDTLLDKEDVTLQELLDEDDVLQECKAQNRKLIDFLVRPENIEELVNLVTQEPSEDMDEKCRYKYPNTACELLTSDVTQINDKLAGEDALLNKVYSFLEAEGPLNPLLASFFSKVMGLLITRKSELMVEFLQSKEDFVGQLLFHLGTSAIMDLLLRLITCIESPECRVTCINWLNEQCLVQKLVKMIDPSESEEKHCNASQSLCDIIRLSREQMSQLQEKAMADPLLEAIESQETITELLNHMFSLERSESVLVNGLAVIQTLLEFRKTGFLGFHCRPEGSSEQMTALDAERLAQGVSSTLLALTPRLKDIQNLLLEPPKQHYLPMPTTVGNLNPPLGNARLQVARLISSLLVTNTHSLNVELAHIDTMSVLMDLYVKYSWNNFLHTQVEQCIGTILSNGNTETEEKVESLLLSQLFTECKVIQRILDAWEDNEQQQNRPGGHRKGYMGHLSRIANHIVESQEKGNNANRIKEYIQDLPEDTREKWETFVSGALAEYNKQNTVDLVGSHALHTSSEDDDTDFRDIPFPQDTAMQQAFSDYQLQQMTSNFIDQFGFNEEEFAEPEERVEAPFTERISSINFEITAPEDNPNAATLFEQACNDRMHQFEEVESDEELWEEKEITFSQNTNSQQKPLPAPDFAAHAQQNSDNSDDSTDSEDELDSPQQIHQTPPAPSSTPSTEKMDVDSEWNNTNEDVSAESAPVAMETGSSSSPWEGANAPSSSTAPSSTENWADFNQPDTNKQTQDGEENWADFTNFTSIDSTSNINSMEPSPRSSSPIAMDTADTSSNNRTAAYLVSSSPVDSDSQVSQSSEVSSQDSSDSRPLGVPEPCSTAVNIESDSLSSEETKCVEGNSLSEATVSPSTSRSEGQKSSLVSEPAESSPESSSVTPLHVENPSADVKLLGNGEGTQEPDSTTTPLEDYDDDDDLSENFNFLATSGLMKNRAKEEEGQADSTEGAEAVSDQERIEAARAQAKEAMEMYESRAASSQNGPV